MNTEPNGVTAMTLHAPTGREVWVVATQGEAPTYHETKAAALARVDALAGPGRAPVCWPMRVEGEA